jgi:SAM-dependent methyltransferase
MTATAPPARDGYREFAAFYDSFTAGSDYEAWTAHVLALAEVHGLRGSEVLDVACGTGNSFLPLRRRGFRVTGCDSSRPMLERAERKAPDVVLVEADMRELPCMGQFDLVTCFDDSLNHLLDEDGLAAALAGMAANLGPAGLLLFDLNTLAAYRTTFAQDSSFTRDGAVYVCRGESSPDAPPGCEAAIRIDAFSPRGDGLYERAGTRQVQRHFPPHRVVALLARAGLDCLGVHGVLDDGSLTAASDETRQLKLLYIARLAEGGDPE